MRSDLACLLAVLAVAGGCTMQRTVATASAIDASPDELDYWDALATERVVTNHDALHGLLLLAGEEIETYDARIAAARARGWIDADALVANESATLGMIAVAVCSVLEVRGGVAQRLIGPTPRTCTRELVYLELIPSRTANQSLSGLEFIDLISRAESLLAAEERS